MDVLKVSGEQASGLCPFHEDSRSSFSCNLVTGVWICFAGCGAGNIYQFAEKVGIDRSKIYKRFDFSDGPKRTKQTQIVPELSIERKRQALKYHNFLIDNWNEIKKPSPWSVEVIERTYTGYDKQLDTFTFVYTNQVGQATNLRWHKRHSIKGHGRCTIFPLHLFQVYKTTVPLILCEGEKDVLTALGFGFQAATTTNGANGIPKDLSPLQNFQNIYVLYDADKAGRTGARNIASVIKNKFPKINVNITELRIK